MIYSKIKKLLTDKNISVPQLAEKIGMTKGGLYAAIENNTLSVKTLEKIAEVFEVPIIYFFEKDNEKWTKAVLITEVKKLDKKIEELAKRNDEYLDMIRSKRSVLRLIYMNIKYFQDIVNEIDIKKNIKANSIKISNGLKLMEMAINDSENFDIEEKRMKEIQEARSKIYTQDPTEEKSKIISEETEARWKSNLDKIFRYGTTDDPPKESGTFFIGPKEDLSKESSKHSIKGIKQKTTKEGKD